MGKKGKWLSSVKNAFRSPIKDGDDEELEAKDLDLFGEIRPLGDKQERPKQKARRWSFGKLAPSEDKEPEKNRDDGNHRETVLSDSKFAMYMYPSQEEWAAVVIQTVFRGYLARRSLRALRGLVRLQAFVRGHRVRRQANTTMQAVAHVQGRIRTSEEALPVQHQIWQRGQPVSKKAPCQDGVTEAGWNDSNLSAKQIEAKVQERQVAALKRERTLAYARTQQQLKRASPKLVECEVEKVRWSSTRPWENRMLEHHSAFKDVGDGPVSKSLDVSATRNAKDTSRRASLAATPARTSGELVNAHMKSRATSPSASSSGSATGSASAAAAARSILTDPQFGTRYSNSGPVVKGHLQATQSVKNKARSVSQPRTRPGGSGSGSGAGAFKTPATMKRLSYAKSEHGHGAPAPATEDANPRLSGKAVVGRPKSGVLRGPHQYRDM